MILTGTAAGRVYGFDPSKRSIELRIGTAAPNSSVIGMNFVSEQEDAFMYYTKSGAVFRSNLYDAFDSSELLINDVILTTADFDRNNQTVFTGNFNGKIHSVSARDTLKHK